MIRIQATFTGYQGAQASVFAAYDPDEGALIVSKESPLRRDRFAGDVLVVTNIADIDRDVLFSADQLGEAIGAFYFLQNSGDRLFFNPEAVRTNPTNAIEQDGITETGPKYRVSDSISNAQMAVLAMAWYCVQRAGPVASAVEFIGELDAILRGEVVSIF